MSQAVKSAVSESVKQSRIEPELTGGAQDRRTRTRNGPSFGSRRGQKLSMGLTKAELIEKYRYKVKIIALRMARDLPASVDVDDLFSMGFLGLMDAAEKFDPSRNVQFDTYAEFRIRGAIIDELRKQDWVPRSARDRMDAFNRASAEVEAKTGQKPTDREISKHMKIPLNKFHEMLRDLGSQTLVCIEDMPEGIESNESSSPDPFRQVIQKEAKAVVDKMLQHLTEQERMVLGFYYYRGLNLKEIATILNVTESRVRKFTPARFLGLRVKFADKFRPLKTCSWHLSTSRFFLFDVFERSLSGRESCDRHAIRRAAHVIEPQFITKMNGSRLTAVFTANSNFKIGASFSPFFDRYLH
ncbi:unnamed protein product [Sphagnum jensenii]|uniref:RNA polymerase sigma-70 domain-containing protein n=1 Tax=Sphagnum jensenii TaxID=128206 RepID=A0ABP0V7F0_9BRYO